MAALKKKKVEKRKCRCGAYLDYSFEKDKGKCSFCQASGFEPRDYPQVGRVQKDPEFEKEKRHKSRKVKRNPFD